MWTTFVDGARHVGLVVMKNAPKLLSYSWATGLVVNAWRYSLSSNTGRLARTVLLSEVFAIDAEGKPKCKFWQRAVIEPEHRVWKALELIGDADSFRGPVPEFLVALIAADSTSRDVRDLAFEVVRSRTGGYSCIISSFPESPAADLAWDWLGHEQDWFVPGLIRQTESGRWMLTALSAAVDYYPSPLTRYEDVRKAIVYRLRHPIVLTREHEALGTLVAHGLLKYANCEDVVSACLRWALPRMASHPKDYLDSARALVAMDSHAFYAAIEKEFDSPRFSLLIKSCVEILAACDAHSEGRLYRQLVARIDDTLRTHLLREQRKVLTALAQQGYVCPWLNDLLARADGPLLEGIAPTTTS